jgi:hypothetical protein
MVIGIINNILQRRIHYLDYYYLHGLRRTRRMTQISQEMGMNFILIGNHILQELKEFGLFIHEQKPPFEGIKNVIYKNIDDTRISIFDYRYSYCVTTSGGSERNRYTSTHEVIQEQTVGYILSNSFDLPGFSLSYKSLGHKIANWFTNKDIELESNSDFTLSYSLRGSDEEAIKRVFNQEFLSSLERIIDQSTHIEAAGNKLIYFQKKPVHLKAMKAFINDILTLLEILV